MAFYSRQVVRVPPNSLFGIARREGADASPLLHFILKLPIFDFELEHNMKSVR